MSQAAQGRDRHSGERHQELHLALKWLLQGADFAGVKWRADCRWSIRGLVMTAMLWAWSGETTLGSRFEQAWKIGRRMLGKEAVPQSSYQAWMKLLRRWTVPLLIALTGLFRARMETVCADRWRIAGFIPLGVDGSRFELPRTAANEHYFSPPRPTARCSAQQKKKLKQKQRKRRRRQLAQSAAARAKKANNPQMWVTTIWHLGIALPWGWRLGPSNSSEREHLRDMLGELPHGTLLVADAGFYGYALWSAALAAGHQLLIRVGSNVQLLKQLGYYVKERNGLVYCWPNHAAAQSQRPLVLRLVMVHNGRHPMYLVTSVIDEKRFSDKQVAQTYALRWGVEVYYRHVKQTFDRTKLRSHSPEHALLEAHWSLLGLWAMTLHAQQQLQSQQLDPRRLSIAGMLRTYRTAMNEYKSHAEKNETLRACLQRALKDTYHRTSKTNRGFPRKKQEHALGPPRITTATAAQRKKAREIRRTLERGLTA